MRTWSILPLQASLYLRLLVLKIPLVPQLVTLLLVSLFQGLLLEVLSTPCIQLQLMHAKQLND